MKIDIQIDFMYIKHFVKITGMHESDEIFKALHAEWEGNHSKALIT